MSKIAPISQAVEYIKSDWKKGKNLTEIALQFKVDAGNLTREFRKCEGMTVKRFVDEKRRLYMLKRLRDGGGFGYQIGMELGFANDFSFYRWVRRAFGISFKKLLRINNKQSTTNRNKE